MTARLWAPLEVADFPRGHYGFVVADPDGNRLLLWSEAPDGKESS